MPVRRWTALATAVLIASVPFATSPAAARTGAPDPARALKRQLVNKHGVRISETSRYFFGGKSTVSGNGTRIKGRLRLAPSGPAAADYTWWDVPSAKTKKKPELHRVIRVGADAYVDAGQYPGPTPEGKEWIRYPANHRGSMGRDMDRDASLQPISVYDPSTLKAVLKRSASKPVSGGFLYWGAMSYKDLRTISKGAAISWTSGRPISGKSKGKIAWRLWTGRDGLLKRLTTTDTAGSARKPPVKRTDTRYTGWGSRVVITAPPADEVIDERDLMEYVREQNAHIPEDEKNS